MCSKSEDLALASRDFETEPEGRMGGRIVASLPAARRSSFSSDAGEIFAGVVVEANVFSFAGVRSMNGRQPEDDVSHDQYSLEI